MIRKILKIIAVLITILVIVFVSAAIVIPKKKSYTQETVISASREDIWKVLTDKAKYTEWQDQLAKVEIKDDRHWTETTIDGQILEMTLEKSEEPERMELSYKIGENFLGSWSGDMRSLTPNKTIIRTTDTIEIDSVIMKVTVAMFFDIEEFAKDWNQKLKKRAEAESMDNG